MHARAHVVQVNSKIIAVVNYTGIQHNYYASRT